MVRCGTPLPLSSTMENKVFKTMRFLLGLLALLILASTVPVAAQGVGQLYWLCGNPLTSPSTQTQWCPVSQQYPLPTGQSFLYANYATTNTFLVKSGPGTLHLVNVNTKGSVASTVTVYDGLSAAGTVIATIDSLNLSGAFQYDIAFTTGLTIVMTGAPNITVSYR